MSVGDFDLFNQPPMHKVEKKPFFKDREISIPRHEGKCVIGDIVDETCVGYPIYEIKKNGLVVDTLNTLLISEYLKEK